MKPHRVRGWLTPKPDPEFDSKCADICSVYNDASAAAQEHVRTVSTQIRQFRSLHFEGNRANSVGCRAILTILGLTLRVNTL